MLCNVNGTVLSLDLKFHLQVLTPYTYIFEEIHHRKLYKSHITLTKFLHVFFFWSYTLITKQDMHN